jgi:hypothetical protein
MQKIFLIVFLFITQPSLSQSVFGYWYGNANVRTNSSANNYLVELILNPEKNYVKGIINYYFKNSYRSLQVQGNYSTVDRQLNLYNIPIFYHGSQTGFEVDCIMNLVATLRVSQTGSDLIGSFNGLPDYKNICTPISLSLHKNADASKTDSVLKAMREFKETNQFWQPSYDDTLVAVDITPRKVINYVTESEFIKREKIVTHILEVESDTLNIEVYDNGEIDGDIISVFFNKQLILSNQKLTHKSIRITLPLDNSKPFNEISMFAENLGLIPPNTALMIIKDGKKKYEMKVTSNLEKTATIRISRKAVVEK